VSKHNHSKKSRRARVWGKNVGDPNKPGSPGKKAS